MNGGWKIRACASPPPLRDHAPPTARVPQRSRSAGIHSCAGAGYTFPTNLLPLPLPSSTPKRPSIQQKKNPRVSCVREYSLFARSNVTGIFFWGGGRQLRSQGGVTSERGGGDREKFSSIFYAARSFIHGNAVQSPLRELR